MTPAAESPVAPRATALLLGVLLAGPAVAQAPPPPVESPTPAPLAEAPLTYPIPLWNVSVPLPEGILAPGSSPVRTTLSVVIGVDGAVGQVALKEGSGLPRLDEAALDAATHLRFQPATQGGVPVEVTIDLPFVFVAPPPPEPVIAPALLRGRIEAKGSREGVPAMPVSAFAATAKPKTEKQLRREAEAKEEGKEPPPPRAEDWELAPDAAATVETDADGHFVLPALPPGDYVIVAGSAAFKLQRWVEHLDPAMEREVVYRVRPVGVPETIVVAHNNSDTPERELRGELLKKMPGAGNDPMAAITSLPGVVHTAPTFTAGDQAQAPVLRGASAEDSVLYLDGLPVPMLFHTMANFAIVGSDLVDKAFLKPAAVEGRYGDLTGGVVGLDLRSPRKDRVGGFLDPGIGLAAFALEGPISEKSRFYVGIRRSYFDIFFKLLVPKDAPLDFATAPYFQDQEIILELDPKPWLRLGLGYVGTLDGLRLIGDPDDPTETPFEFELNGDMHRIFVRADMRPKSGLRNRAQVALTFWGTRLQVADFFETEDRHTTVHVADDVHVPLLPWLAVEGGILGEFDSHRSVRNVPMAIREDTGPSSSTGEEDNLQGIDKGWRTWIGGYVGLPITPIPQLTFTPEFRLDGYPQLQAVAPQFRARMGVQAHKKLRISLAGGRYVQSPSSEEINETTGNPDLDPEGAWHVNLGAQWAPADWLDVDVQGYAKFTDHQVVSSSSGAADFGALAELAGLPAAEDDPTHGLSNDGIGRIWGAEVFARFGLVRRVGISGWLGYSLSWAQRKDFPDEEWRWFQHDRRHQITALLQLQLPGEFTIGARWLLQTGAPLTAVVDSTFYADAGAFIPVYGPLYGERGLPYQQLDLRIDKRFRKDNHVIDIYIDVTNVTASKGSDFEIYSFDYREKESFFAIPAVNFAVRVEF